MDALSEVLRVVRLVGAIFVNATFTAPWRFDSPRADFAAPILEPGAERVIIFHAITEGECIVSMEGQPTMDLKAGDVIHIGGVKLVFHLKDEVGDDTGEHTGEHGGIRPHNVIAFGETQRLPDDTAPDDDLGARKSKD